MIPLDKETFECYMERLLEQLEKLFRAASVKEKKHANYLNGEKLYDNQDICLLLNISKRTLQRYLPYRREDRMEYFSKLDSLFTNRNRLFQQ